jgi:hypothetical protein
MSLTKLKINIIVLGLSCLMCFWGYAVPRQSCYSAKSTADSVSHPTAETILKIVFQHLPEQNPSYFDSYSAISYHRFRIKINLSPIAEGITIDTTESKANLNNTKFVFSSETLNLQKLLKPGFSQIENLSTKSDGIDEGSGYTKIASSLSDISILKPIVTIFNKSYLSPFSQLAIGNYAFSLEDSITSSGDSLLKVSFRPKLGKQFDGFIGTALIDTKEFVIRQVRAQTTHNDPQESLLVINQNFEHLNSTWLPSDRNVKVFFKKKNSINQSDTNEDNLIAESTINIYQQQINPSLSPDDFKTTAQPSLETDRKPAIPSNNYAYIPINQKDSLSLLKADSASIAENHIKQTKLIRFITEGKIPLSYFNLDYNRIFGYNIFEGLKLGVGGETNRLLSKYFTIGGYISYGLKDRSIRNGEWINYYPLRGSDLRVQVSYKDVNMELGEPEFLETKTLLNPESYRYLLIKNMYATKRYSTGVEYRPINALNTYVFGDLSDNHSPQNTTFLIEHPFNPIRLTRIGLQLRYTPGIILQMEDGRKKEMNIPKSDYYLTFVQGLTVLGGEYHYTKTEFKGKFNLPFSSLGTSTIVLRGGIMSQIAPVVEYFNSYGSFAGTFSLAAPFSFATMQLNEFSAANYAAIHFRHDFSTCFFPETSLKQPAFIFAQNIGFGRLDDQYLTQYNLKDYRKGFYETGFEVNNLLRMNYLSWGVGIYYRYGPYQLSSMHDNFAYKFGFFFKL